MKPLNLVERELSWMEDEIEGCVMTKMRGESEFGVRILWDYYRKKIESVK